VNGWLGRTATQELTRIGLVLAPRRAQRRWIGRAAFAAVLVAIGACGSWLVATQPTGDDPRLAAAMGVKQALRGELEQAQLKLRMAEAHSQELERQVDGLNQRLREVQDQLTFFRKAREGQH
jgi:hypothetical protein